MSEYGGTAEAFAWWRGRVVPGARMRLFTDRAMTTPITDLFTPEGEQITDGFIRADDAGWYRFATGADYQSIFGEMVGGDGRLYRLDRADVGQRVFGLESSVIAVQATAEQAATVATRAGQKADEAHALVTGELAGVNTPEGLVRLNSFGKVGAAYLPADSSASNFLTWADYPMPDAGNWPAPGGYLGMSSLIPENTAEGVRGFLDITPMIPDQQVPVVWLSVGTTNEGAAVVLRASGAQTATTTKPYTLWDMGPGTIRQARVSGRRFHPGWPDLAVPSLDDILSEFAGRMLFVLEVAESPNTASHVWQTVKNYGMEQSVIIADEFQLSWRWAQAGAITMGVVPQGTTITQTQITDLVGQGITWVGLHCAGVDPSNGATQFAQARAAGLRTAAYPLTRHYELDRLQEWGTQANPWGTDMYVTPDPLYCHWEKTRHKWRFWLPRWDTGTYAAGQFGNGPGRDAVDATGAPVRHRVYAYGSFTPEMGGGGSLLVRNDPAATNSPAQRLDPGGLALFWEHQGWACPIQVGPGQMQDITTTVHYRRGSGGSWAAFAFGLSDDRPHQYQPTVTPHFTGPPGQHGWLLAVRGDGNMYLRQITNGQLDETDLASVTSGPGAITPGPGVAGVLQVRIRLTPSQVIADLMNQAGAIQRTLTFADSSSAHRGPYLSFGSRHAELVWTATQVGVRTSG